jgi:predicted metal-dependent peptidase
MIREIETDYNLDEVLIPWLQRSTFFCELSRHIRKFPTDSIPTAAVMYDVELDDVAMCYNPQFMKAQTIWQSEGLLTHEMYHIIFGHLHARCETMPLPLMKNVATDLADNSIIMHNAEAHKPRSIQRNDFPLPHGGLIPGRWPTNAEGREPSEVEKEGRKLSALIARLPPMLSSEEYYNILKEEAQKAKKKANAPGKGPGKGSPGKGDEQGPPREGSGNGSGGVGEDIGDLLNDEGLGTVDSHDLWDTVPDGMRDYVEGKVRSMVAKATQAADSHADGWGNMPHEVRDAIRRSVSTVIDWRAVLRQFVGALNPGGRSTSIRRMNRKYPKVHPGLKRGRVPKIVVFIDQSGSVSDQMNNEFFGELVTLTRKVEVDVVHFDVTCGVPYTWKRGTVPTLERTKQGGTDFEAPNRLVNRRENRGRWDGALVLTDGQCNKPRPSRIKRGWVLGRGQRLMFPTNELQVMMSDPKRLVGAWR